jgi:hypothetical protein
MVYTVDGREYKSPWIAALSRWNAGKGVWCTPRKGTAEYAQVRAIQDRMTRKGAPPRPKSAQGMSGAGLLGRIDRPSTAPWPSAKAFADMYRDGDVVAMPKREPAMRTLQYVTLESTKERPASEVVWAPPPKQKKKILLTSVADVVDTSDANGPWEDVDERSSQAKQLEMVTERLRSKEWRGQQVRKYGKVREYGKRAPIKKKRKRVKT